MREKRRYGMVASGARDDERRGDDEDADRDFVDRVVLRGGIDGISIHHPCQNVFRWIEDKPISRIASQCFLVP